MGFRPDVPISTALEDAAMPTADAVISLADAVMTIIIAAAVTQ
jgi:hypothetical protein